MLRWRIVLPIVAMCWGAYLAVLRPWLLSWGARAVELDATLPGDELDADHPSYVTRAITIDASPSTVWSWIVQIGQDRAGFYSNTWLENLIGSDIHNASSIHPGWQHRAVGDRVVLANPALYGRLESHTDIVALEPGRMIENIPGRFVLLPLDGGSTRLLYRETDESQGPIAWRVAIWDPMHFVMVQRMLRGIEERAEGRPLVPGWLAAIARIGWLVAGLCVLGGLASRSRWWPWLPLPIVPATAIIYATGDLDAALAAFLAIGITTLGALELGRYWWRIYVLLATAVLFTLLLAPDAHAALGVALLSVVGVTASRWSVRGRSRPRRVLVAITKVRLRSRVSGRRLERRAGAHVGASGTTRAHRGRCAPAWHPK